MHKFYSILIGENPHYTENFQPASKRKIALYGNILMIPVILWFVNVYLLVRCVLQAGTFMAIISGLVAAFVIFIVERAIIMSNGNRNIFWFRIALGIMIAALGSISFDEVIFKNDIDNKVASYKKLAVDSAENKIGEHFKPEIQLQQSIVNQKDSVWRSALNDAKVEADGTGGSRQRLVGSIAKLKLKVADKQEADYKNENKKLAVLNDSIARLKLQARSKAEADYNENALLLRIEAMFDLLSESRAMLVVWIIFTGVLFFLELLVVILKMGSKSSIDEELEKARDTIIREKTKRILDRRMVMFEPDQYLPGVKAANTLLARKNNTII